MNTVDILDKAIYHHSQWKMQMRKLMYGGKSSLEINTISNDHSCEFGKWLQKENPYTLPNYDEIVDKHHIFHLKAAEVAQLIASGDILHAEASMQFGGDLSKASTDLVTLLLEIQKQLS